MLVSNSLAEEPFTKGWDPILFHCWDDVSKYSGNWVAPVTLSPEQTCMTQCIPRTFMARPITIGCRPFAGAPYPAHATSRRQYQPRKKFARVTLAGLDPTPIIGPPALHIALLNALLNSRVGFLERHTAPLNWPGQNPHTSLIFRVLFNTVKYY